MIGYRNASYDPREKTVTIGTWTEDGDRIDYSVNFRPYFFVEDPKGNETSIFNTKLRRKEFESVFDKNKYIKETGIKRVYENFNAVQHCLIDRYWEGNETEEFAKFPLKVYFLDIEAVAEEFPNALEAKFPINVITIYCTQRQKFFTWGTKSFNVEDKAKVEYRHFAQEIDMLEDFIRWFKIDPCDILSGWNSAGFDIPYIVNRINYMVGENAANQLSPVNRVYSRTFMGSFGREETHFHIDGISCVDYLDIYKRFSFSNRESYKLNDIAELELDEKKIDYGDQTLLELMQSNWQVFVEYNIQDVLLLVKMEEKLQFINLLRMLAYVGCTTFEGAMGTLSTVTGAAAIRARQKGQRISTYIRGEDDGSKNPGAYVADPLPGFQENIISFDANSLYPNVMISLNMSPETKIGKIVEIDDENVTVRHVNGQVFTLTRQKFLQFIKAEEIAISKARILFSQKKKGIMPDLVDFYYKERKKVQKELKAVKLEIANLQNLLKD